MQLTQRILKQLIREVFEEELISDEKEILYGGELDEIDDLFEGWPDLEEGGAFLEEDELYEDDLDEDLF